MKFHYAVIKKYQRIYKTITACEKNTFQSKIKLKHILDFHYEKYM